MPADSIPEVEWSRLRLGSLLGQGTFGKVFEANVTPFGRCAVKVPHAGQQLGNLNDFRAEANRMARASHENVLAVLALALKPDGENQFAIIMPRMEMSLKNAIQLRDGTAPLVDGAMRQTLAYQAANGLKALHAAGVLHRDIKSDNALVNLNGTGGLRLCWTDFGVSKTGTTSTLHTMQTMTQVGTLGYIAPEISDVGGNSPIEYRESVDVYAFGVVLGELVSGKPPCFPGRRGIDLLPFWMRDNNFDPVQCVDQSAFQDHQDVATLLLELVCLCTENDKSQRPDMTSVVHKMLGAPQSQSFDTDSWDSLSTSTTSVPEVLNEPRMCKVCLNDKVNTLLQPCQHACMCETCTLHVLGARGKCPICRQSFETWVVADPSAPEVQQTFLQARQPASNSEENVTLSDQDPPSRILRGMDTLKNSMHHVVDQVCLALVGLAGNIYNNRMAQLAVLVSFVSFSYDYKNNSGVQENIPHKLALVACFLSLCYWCGNSSIQAIAFVPLKYLARNKNNQIAFVGILRAMDEHKNKADVQAYACGALWNLADNNDNKVALMEQGAAQRILRAMDDHKNSSHVQYRACGVLRNLAVNNDNKVALMELGAAQRLRRTIENHRLQNDVREQARSVLRIIL